MIQANLSLNQHRFHCAQASSYLKLNRRFRKILIKSIVPLLIILTICTPIGLKSAVSNNAVNYNLGGVSTNQFGIAQNSLSYSSSGDSQQFNLQGVVTNPTQNMVLLDPSSQELVSISAPQGWTGNALSGTIEHLSTQVGALTNELLDDYHTERYIIPGSAWNSETYYVPDGWSIGKGGDSTTHPGHGGLYWFTSAGTGRESSMGWRPSVLFDTTKTLDPSMEIYMSQQMQLPWREVYSCEVTFFHRVPTQTLNNVFYLFLRVGDYEVRFNVFETGYTTNTWLQGTVSIPMSAFANIPIPGAVSLDIGLSTDYSGLSPVNINNFVFIDEIKVLFEARPFPEQIDLTANNTIITGLTQGSVSPYIPDGDSRDCYDHYSTGISTSQVRAGVYGSTSWSAAGKYQIGMQFPLNIQRRMSDNSEI